MIFLIRIVYCFFVMNVGGVVRLVIVCRIFLWC